MTNEKNVHALQRMGAECIGENDLSVFGDIWADEVVDHDPAPGQGPGGAGLKGFWSDFLEAFPDLQIEVDELMADDDRVTIAYRVNGTHQGEFMGAAPTGSKMEIRGLQMSRHREDGKIVERWGSSDVLGILQQIGATDL